MTRFLAPIDRSDEFAWICDECGQWNRADEMMCRTCRSPKPPQPEVLRDLLERIHDEHPRRDESE